MTSHPAFTHGPVTAAPATKARSRSSCEALGQQAFGQKRNSPATSSTGDIREVVGMSSRCASVEFMPRALAAAIMEGR